MKKTMQALNKLNDKAKRQIDFYKSNYGKDFATDNHILGYLYALDDVGIITETDRILLFSYVTIKNYADTNFRTEDCLW